MQRGRVSNGSGCETERKETTAHDHPAQGQSHASKISYCRAYFFFLAVFFFAVFFTAFFAAFFFAAMMDSLIKKRYLPVSYGNKKPAVPHRVVQYIG